MEKEILIRFFFLFLFFGDCCIKLKSYIGFKENRMSVEWRAHLTTHANRIVNVKGNACHFLTALNGLLVQYAELS